MFNTANVSNIEVNVGGNVTVYTVNVSTLGSRPVVMSHFIPVNRT